MSFLTRKDRVRDGLSGWIYARSSGSGYGPEVIKVVSSESNT